MAQLQYSELTKIIYFTDKRKKIPIDDNNFIQMLLFWMQKDIPLDGTQILNSVTRTISVNGKPKYVLNLKKVI
jgi:hypothetical protein